MRPSSAKAKGRKLQQYAKAVLDRVFGFEDGDIESRPMGSGGVDLMCSPKVRKRFPISIECKNTKSFPSVSALEQSKFNTKDGTIPAVVWKPFGKGYDESIIYFNFEDLATLMAKLTTDTDVIKKMFEAQLYDTRAQIKTAGE